LTSGSAQVGESDEEEPEAHQDSRGDRHLSVSLGGRRRAKRFPPDTPVRFMKDWQLLTYAVFLDERNAKGA
jgi:hypothetical protein